MMLADVCLESGNKGDVTQHCAVCLVTQSCPILCDPMNCNPPGFSVHGDSPSRNIGLDCHALLQGIFPTQRPNPGLPHCRWIIYCLSHKEAQEYWSEQPIPSPGDLSEPGIELGSPALQADSLPTEIPGKPIQHYKGHI